MTAHQSKSGFPCAIFIGASLLLVGCVAVPARAADADMRQQYGVRSLEAAEKISDGMRMVESKKPRQAIELLDAAIRLEPDSSFAWYWKAISESAAGDVDKAIESYKKSIGLAQEGSHMLVGAADDLALVFASLKEYDESNYWFSRAIVADPDDGTGLVYKAYRNMAITLHDGQKRLGSAAMAALLGAEADSEKVSPDMVQQYDRDGAKDEVSRVLFLDNKVLPVAPRLGPDELRAHDSLHDKMFSVLSRSL